MERFTNKIVFMLALMVCVGLVNVAFAQKSKGKKGTFALTNAKIETITQGTVNGTVVIENGKISGVGADLSVPSGAEVIDCNGLSIYPGLFDGGTRLGLLEVGSDPRTKDYDEIGEVTPQMKALTAVNPNSVHIPVTRVNGVTTALSVPQGGLFPGTAALINLHGYTPEQMYAGFDAVVMNFPVTGKSSRWDRRSEEELKKATDKALKNLKDVWKKAVEYHQLDSAISAGQKGQALGYYPEMKALLPVVRREKPLLVEVNKAKDIDAAIDWVEANNVKAIFMGVAEGWRVAEKLAKANIPVIVGPVLNQANRAYDKYDRPYANPGIMQKAGVKVAIRTSDTENVRNLPYNAGFAATYGMGREEALKAVTIVPAQIFGVDKQLGSIEVGKEATLFVTDGDPFETQTKVKFVFIDGWMIPIESRHTKLYDEFLTREPGLKK